MHSTNLERLTVSYANAGDYARAIATTRTLLHDDPWREDAVRTLLSLRYAAGDRADALHEYERFAERMQRDLDATPTPETVSLYESIRSGPNSSAAEGPVSALERAVIPATMPFVGRSDELLRLRQMWCVRCAGSAASPSSAAKLESGNRVARRVRGDRRGAGRHDRRGAATFPEAVPYQLQTSTLPVPTLAMTWPPPGCFAFHHVTDPLCGEAVYIDEAQTAISLPPTGVASGPIRENLALRPAVARRLLRHAFHLGGMAVYGNAIAVRNRRQGPVDDHSSEPEYEP